MVASVAMVLKYWGFEASPEAIAGRVPLYKEGTTGKDLLEYVESVGFRGFLLQPELQDLLLHLRKNRPLIVALPGRGSLWHAMVLTGYDQSSFWFNDPASGKVQQRSIESFRREWEKTGRWTFLVTPP